VGTAKKGKEGGRARRKKKERNKEAAHPMVRLPAKWPETKKRRKEQVRRSPQGNAEGRIGTACLGRKNACRGRRLCLEKLPKNATYIRQGVRKEWGIPDAKWG